MTWNPFESPCDYFRLANIKSPGICEVSGADLAMLWDERKGYGLSGARVVFRGNKLVRFTIKVKLYEVEEYTIWTSVFATLLKRPPLGTRPKALDIWHPFLEYAEIKSAVVEKNYQPVQTDNGEWTVGADFIEFRPPVPALSKPEGSKATTVDPVEKIIEKLSKQVEELAK